MIEIIDYFVFIYSVDFYLLLSIIGNIKGLRISINLRI